MKRILVVAAAFAFACAAPAFAADAKTDAKAPNAQNQKMSDCNTKAGDKKGDDRKAFMKSCLSSKPVAEAKPESKISMCTKKTAGLKGDERSKAQSECMKAA